MGDPVRRRGSQGERGDEEKERKVKLEITAKEGGRTYLLRWGKE